MTASRGARLEIRSEIRSGTRSEPPRGGSPGGPGPPEKESLTSDLREPRSAFKGPRRRIPRETRQKREALEDREDLRTSLSKRISWFLRRRRRVAASKGLRMDRDGWVLLRDLIEVKALGESFERILGRKIDRPTLSEILRVSNSERARYELDETGGQERVRALGPRERADANVRPLGPRGCGTLGRPGAGEPERGSGWSLLETLPGAPFEGGPESWDYRDELASLGPGRGDGELRRLSTAARNWLEGRNLEPSRPELSLPCYGTERIGLSRPEFSLPCYGLERIEPSRLGEPSRPEFSLPCCGRERIIGALNGRSRIDQRSLETAFGPVIAGPRNGALGRWSVAGPFRGSRNASFGAWSLVGQAGTTCP